MKGSTICTSPETVFIQIVYFFHVFCIYSVLPSTDLTYFCVPGDQGGPTFLDSSFFLRLFHVQIGIMRFVH
jgi:hypothetical protein